MKNINSSGNLNYKIFALIMSANASTAASIILLKKKAVFLTMAPILNQAVCAVSVWLSMYEQPTR